MSLENQIHRDEETGDLFRLRRHIDNSLLAKASYYIDVGKPIWFLGVILYFAIGFDFRTPAQKSRELGEKVDTVQQRVSIRLDAVNKRLDSMAEAVRQTDKKVDVLISSSCLTSKLPPDIRRAIHLNCDTP